MVDIEKTNLDILDALVPEASTSMQRDIWAAEQCSLYKISCKSAVAEIRLLADPFKKRHGLTQIRNTIRRR